MAIERIISPRAADDLEDIFRFISKDNEKAAWNVIASLEKCIYVPAERPLLGSVATSPARGGLRRMSVRPYVVFYRATDETLEIVRILHSSRDLQDPRLFGSK